MVRVTSQHLISNFTLEWLFYSYNQIEENKRTAIYACLHHVRILTTTDHFCMLFFILITYSILVTSAQLHTSDLGKWLTTWLACDTFFHAHNIL